MVTIRSRFYKKGDMVFISHLDLIRVFERAIRRANISVAYTQGFNPHPIMAFATALGVGVASEGEYIDIKLDDNMDSGLFMNELNNVLPEGLKIIKSRIITDKAKSLMSIICSSTYLVKLETKKILSETDIRQHIKDLVDREMIIELKQKRQRRGRRRKPGFREINIRPFIKSIELLLLDGQKVLLKMHLAAGSRGNLKPEVVVDKLHELTNLPIEQYKTRVKRLDLFVDRGDKFITPLDKDVWNV
ncbi:MAG TPA: TIGR03936 family radical SAM-associated protein [Oscillospiraceae bacterium]|nr:TIGR03936 family radical SAM-associated protein [Oscillospiraceae bacterium]